MIAYRTFADCPEQDRPPGVLLTFPWQTEEADDTSVERGFTVVTQEEYEALVASLAAANGNSMLIASILKGVLTPAIAKGQELIVTFAAENISLGITQAGMTTQVRAVTADVVSALSTGSLHDAVTAARAIPPASYDATFVTAARLLSFINKIEDYFGMPRSTSI